MMGLTKKQSDVYEAIKAFIEQNGVAPTRQEIAQLMGFRSPNAAEQHIKKLVATGYLINTGTARGIRLVPTRSSSQNDILVVPLIGKVAAGQPIMSEQHTERLLSVNASLFEQTPDYFLKVEGNSMENIGILDGDLIGIHKTHGLDQIRNGQIVVARVQDSNVTVKRFEREGETVWLLPENDKMGPIVVDLKTQKLEIDGVYIGLLRSSKF